MSSIQLKKTAIIGMGALGLLYGNQIQEGLGSGAVSFIVDKDRYARYQEKKFTICGVEKNFNIECADEATPADLVIVAVKYNSLQSALDTMKNVVDDHTVIMSVMNGITSEEIIGERYGFDNMIYTVAQGMDAMRFGDALNYTKMGELRIGIKNGMNEEGMPVTGGKASNKAALDKVIELFEAIKMPYTADEDIIYRMWGKFMLNVGINQTCMMYETTYSGALAEGEANDTLIGAMNEVIAVGNAEGVKLSQADVEYYIAILRTLDPDGVPSMRQDGIAKRKTEVDMFAGTVIEIAKKHNIHVPVNERIYMTVKEMEKQFT